MRKLLSVLLILALLAGLLIGCAGTGAGDDRPALSQEKVTLKVAGGWPDCRALDLVASAFTAKYPNCTIEYEYVQDYYESLAKRMEGDAPFDLFFTTNIQADNVMLPYAMDLGSREDLDLSQTFEGLIRNFAFMEEDGTSDKIYALPLGAEMRGLYVNVTLLESLGLSVPTDQAALLNCCRMLQENGYIPFHGNPGAFAQMLIYPWICNQIVNGQDPDAWQAVNTHKEGASELFREPLAFLYSLVENGYYDYKKAQTDLNLFNDASNEAYSRDFLNIVAKGEEWEKLDDVGRVAFMPSPMSMKSVVDKTKADYHSDIEYVFVMAPIGVDGGFAYMSPAHGIAAAKDSENADWAVRFLDFLYQPENNQIFADAFNVVPNTKEAFSYIKTLFDVPENHITHLGQVTFDYGFYGVVTPVLTDISKANNPKYMYDDGKGNLSLYPFDTYMAQLEEGLKAQ